MSSELESKFESYPGRDTLVNPGIPREDHVYSVGNAALNGVEHMLVIPDLTGPQKTWLSKISSEEEIWRFKSLNTGQRNDFVARLSNRFRHMPLKRTTPEVKDKKIIQLEGLMSGESFSEIGNKTDVSSNAVSTSLSQMALSISKHVSKEEIGRLIGVSGGTEEELPRDKPDYIPPALPRNPRTRGGNLITGDESEREKGNGFRVKNFNLKKFIEEHPDLPAEVIERRYDIASEDDTHMLRSMVRHFGKDPGVMVRVDASHGTEDPNHYLGSYIGENHSLNPLMHQVRRYRLLDERPEEVELMKIMKTGVAAYRHMVGNYDASSKELMLLAREGTIAFKAFYHGNLRLALDLTHKEYKKGKAKQLEFSDLLQAGFKGLQRGIEKFDETKGWKFSTYGTWWINQALSREIANLDRTIRMPVNIVGHINKLRYVRQRLVVELERDPTAQELYENYDQQKSKSKLSMSKIEHVLKMEKQPASLNVKIGEGEDSSEIGDFIEDESGDREVEKLDEKDHLARIIARTDLSNPEKFVLSIRFGLQMDELIGQEFRSHAQDTEYSHVFDRAQSIEQSKGQLTHKTVGELLRITGSRAHQIETNALKKLQQAAIKLGNQGDEPLRQEENKPEFEVYTTPPEYLKGLEDAA